MCGKDLKDWNCIIEYKVPRSGEIFVQLQINCLVFCLFLDTIPQISNISEGNYDPPYENAKKIVTPHKNSKEIVKFLKSRTDSPFKFTYNLAVCDTIKG